ncbi:MAG: ankyrin repeat domain-containing protein [Methanosarcinaceae archaeon]
MGLFKKKESILKAISENQYQKAMYLIKNGGKVNEKDEKKATPLHIACEKNQSEIVSLLLTAGADVNAKDYEKETPLHIACRYSSLKVVSNLMEHRADVNAKAKVDSTYERGETPLHIACRRGNPEIVNELPKSAADVNAKDKAGETPLHEACKQNHNEVVSLLVIAGADVSSKDKEKNTPLSITVKNGNSIIVEKLTSSNKISNYSKSNLNQLLIEAVKNNHASIAGYLLKYGADINSSSYFGTLLHKAIQNRNIGMVIELIEGKADVNKKDTAKRTPLHIACEQFERCRGELVIYIIALLVDAGADPLIKDKFLGGKTAKDYALAQNKMKAVSIMEGKTDTQNLLSEAYDINLYFENVTFDKFEQWKKNAEESNKRIRANDSIFNGYLYTFGITQERSESICYLLNQPKKTLLTEGNWAESEIGHGFFIYSMEDELVFRGKIR